MKDMSLQYFKALRFSLGIDDSAELRKLPFLNACEGYVLGLEGRILPWELPEGTLDTLNLDAPFDALRPFLRRRLRRDGNWVFLGIREPEALLNCMTDAKLLCREDADRALAFARMQPIFSPAKRPELGLILQLDGNHVADFGLAARILDGWGAVPHGFYYPMAMNLELTSQCPLRCPQCYCHLMAGKHMPLEVAENWLTQAGKLGVHTVNLSGGETMCYPWLKEVIQIAVRNGLEPDVALSGYGITDESLDSLIAADVNGIYVSLNGPTEQINAKTRDGYRLAIALLEKLKVRNFPNVCINWVVHDSNADTLPRMLELAERYGVQQLMVMAFKPDSRNELPSLPTREQMENIAAVMKAYRGPVQIQVETCYSSMRALVSQSLFGNSNSGPFKGCGAGRDSFSVALDGKLTPCRHIDHREAVQNLEEYWQTSPLIQLLRLTEANPKSPCADCGFCGSCRHCMAVNLKLNGSIYKGDATCPFGGRGNGGEDRT